MRRRTARICPDRVLPRIGYSAGPAGERGAARMRSQGTRGASPPGGAGTRGASSQTTGLAGGPAVHRRTAPTRPDRGLPRIGYSAVRERGTGGRARGGRARGGRTRLQDGRARAARARVPRPRAAR